MSAPLDVNSTFTQLERRLGSDSKLADNEDISTGVSQPVRDVSSFTIYLDVAGAIDVTVEISPDRGSNYYELPNNSPVSFGGVGTDMLRITYDCNHIKLTGSDTTKVTAQIREVV